MTTPDPGELIRPLSEAHAEELIAQQTAWETQALKEGETRGNVTN